MSCILLRMLDIQLVERIWGSPENALLEVVIKWVCVPITQVKEFSAAARVMQSSSKELSTLVADRV